ncbi:CBS domain-containing protein [Desulfuribacillus alkaliarsenatis]|uniref:CBS domain-containing protein n=1 Tax=Desulfuribacillus alkaliarsenatis TaxID=766136 RepID=A0A1E5G075_9FIRM|nr:CBS domain-containing protein [Desulfuribacillus alkaliarsenatis]OEF96214.1 hypothetical protein BHF68_08595 [Desulfuribacillus alkaliarsenatis]
MVVVKIELTKRQEKIIDIVKSSGPITGENIAERLSLSRAALRPDLAILTMSGFLDARPRVGYFYLGKEMYGKKLREMQVKDYKSIPIVVPDQATAYDAMCMMFMEDVGTVLVVRDINDIKTLVGIVTKKDLLKAAIGKQNMSNVPISMVMTRSPHIITVGNNESLYIAAKKLVEYQVDCIPVINLIDNQYELMGYISRDTITRIFVELASIHSV